MYTQFVLMRNGPIKTLVRFEHFYEIGVFIENLGNEYTSEN